VWRCLNLLEASSPRGYTSTVFECRRKGVLYSPSLGAIGGGDTDDSPSPMPSAKPRHKPEGKTEPRREMLQTPILHAKEVRSNVLWQPLAIYTVADLRLSSSAAVATHQGLCLCWAHAVSLTRCRSSHISSHPQATVLPRLKFSSLTPMVRACVVVYGKTSGSLDDISGKLELATD
jgi:hypothetical protein